ncbi:hypothetical protein JR316_0006368 [Psilocybe cubensis]|uniref:Uncharacterized protein n=2 Tax=Psilocybe cubensis TaxID=181762 RepID=A0ACB8H1Q4_PSICU|nr:hypothetical protein JR316_0006368 [Psilocybe cubensis]KAH9481838.1 hypothetical protein JR316_0006368 [Psilocybe cubensis]
MVSPAIRALSAFAVLAVLVNAQEPTFKGQLLIEPALTSAKCITAASNTDGAAVTIQTCTGSPSQQWTFSGGTVRVFDNKCLDVTNGTTVDGTKMQIWTCTSNNANQQFVYTTWDNSLAWANKGKCIDLPGGSTADGTRIQLWSCSYGNINQNWKVGYLASNLPTTSQEKQSGVNNCGTGSSPSSSCQTIWINSASDFCLWAPPSLGAIGDTERDEVAWCTKSGRGARTIPDGTLQGVHFVQTPEYVQVTGVGDFTKMNIPRGDAGGELDNRGADGRGNPIGGLVYGNTFGTGLQYHEWTSFISDSEFCFRACVGPRATVLCNHIYDVMGCSWNMPANYDSHVYEDCDGDSDLPMGVYGTSTWHQGTSPTPTAHPAASSSNCKPLPTVTVSPLMRRDNTRDKRRLPVFPHRRPT